jgi:hypothetical protein
MQQVRSRYLSQWSKEDKVYVGDRRVVDPSKPPAQWVLSSKVSPTSAGLPLIVVYPNTFGGAVEALQSIHAAGLIFDDEPVTNPFPFGPTWVNLKDGKDSWAVWSAKASHRSRVEGQSGVLGHQYQDGAKFMGSCDRNALFTLQGIILKKEWMGALARELGALLVQYNDWATGAGLV